MGKPKIHFNPAFRGRIEAVNRVAVTCAAITQHVNPPAPQTMVLETADVPNVTCGNCLRAIKR
jgi:hypothetical protein